MYEIVFETRKQGTAASDPSPPLTSLVLEAKFDTPETAVAAIKGFQMPYDKKWEDPDGSRFFASDEGEQKYEIWYWRSV